MISFIIPVYNKGEVLFLTLSSLINHLKKNHFLDYEIIVVNDGSTDNSFEEAVRFKKFNGDTAKVKIFNYTQNIGKGFALRFGFSKSKGNPVVFLDGDMNINTQQVIKAIHSFNKIQPDMVIASKYLPASRVYYSPIRYIYSLMLKLVIRLFFNLSVSDTQVGLKIFQRHILQKILPKLVVKRFATDLELLIVAHMYGYTKIIEIPVVINHSIAEQTSINLNAVRLFCTDILAIYYRKNILKYYTQKKVNLNPHPTPSFSVQVA